jgi:sulfur carrier protein
MRVLLNGADTEVADGVTIGAMLDRLDVARARRGVAVAVDGEVVPRGEWDERALASGAHIEVVAAIQGG